MEYLMIGLVFIFSWQIYKRNNPEYEINGIFNNDKKLIRLLLGWIVFGFFTRFDYSEAFGCVISFEPFWELDNILFSTISFALISFASKTNNKKIIKYLVLIELIYWILKLIIFKGGYAVGFGGTPDIQIVIYDLVAVMLRLLLLYRLMEQSKIKIKKIWIAAIVVLGVKILFFTTPLSVEYYDIQSIKEAQEQRSKMIGSWEGLMQCEKNSEKEERLISLRINRKYIHFDSLYKFEGRYEFFLEHSNFGYILNRQEQTHFDVLVQDISSNSMNLDFIDFEEKITLDLKRKEN